MDKEILIRKSKWSAQGWLSISIRNFGLGFHLYGWRDKKHKPLNGGLAINFYLPLVDFHLEIWKRS